MYGRLWAGLHAESIESDTPTGVVREQTLDSFVHEREVGLTDIFAAHDHAAQHYAEAASAAQPHTILVAGATSS